MATTLYSINPGDSVESITVTAAGPATTSKSIELNVDQATTIVTEGASTRAIKKGEVIEALNKLVQRVIKDYTNLSE